MRVSRIASWCLSAFALSFGVVASADPIGLVLSGGGAKGAYEVGVWQALQAAGLASNVVAISGTSVGALNAALFATKPESAERIWLEKMHDVFTINTNRVGESIQKTLNDASNAVEIAKSTGKDWKGVASFLLATLVRVADDYVKEVETPELRIGYFDSSKLAAALDETLPRTWGESVPAVYVTAVEKGKSDVAVTWRLNAEPHERRILMLRASAAIPIGFDTVLIDGKPYVDGGWESKGGDNVPLKPILDNHPEIKTVIVVYLRDETSVNADRRAKNIAAASKAGTCLVEIIPSENINGTLGVGGVFNADLETVHRLIELGRNDTKNILKKGNRP